MQQQAVNIFAKITGVTYTPFLCKKLNVFNDSQISKALSSEATFILKFDEGNQIAVSWWVSPKRTRSYPYARVYDSLSFSGKKVTVIPLVKDEGKEGDRDFLQWDTISLMSLLGVYAVISYYVEASPSSRYRHKITDQRFDLDHVRSEIQKLLSYQSDALHWNLSQISNAGKIGQKALDSYAQTSRKLCVEMHSWESAKMRIRQLLKGKEHFIRLSRELALKAQRRESVTIQPKEYLTGIKATLTIKNYLGGSYYFTCDEVEIHKRYIYLIEGKHTKTGHLPSSGDIKDGLLKMILFTNLEDVKIEDVRYNPVPILKLTTGSRFGIELLNKYQKELLALLKQEADTNGFKVMVNKQFL